MSLVEGVAAGEEELDDAAGVLDDEAEVELAAAEELVVVGVELFEAKLVLAELLEEEEEEEEDVVVVVAAAVLLDELDAVVELAFVVELLLDPELVPDDDLLPEAEFELPELELLPAAAHFPEFD